MKYKKRKFWITLVFEATFGANDLAHNSFHSSFTSPWYVWTISVKRFHGSLRNNRIMVVNNNIWVSIRSSLLSNSDIFDDDAHAPSNQLFEFHHTCVIVVLLDTISSWENWIFSWNVLYDNSRSKTIHGTSHCSRFHAVKIRSIFKRCD